MKIKLMLLPQSTYCSEGVANFDPHEDKVDVITPVSLLFRGVANFNVMMIMMIMM